MEKVFIKPVSKEILIKDSLKEGYFDIYSYDYHADDQKRKLGSLYIIGNVSQGPAESSDEAEGVSSEDAPDVAYMVNLVASLAKREYYARPDLLPKEAFTATLKKINEIVEEFFQNKNTKINIGIFAVAGEDILISKLGKFKIILSRDNQSIDILNNITLFSKEHVDEKEFSNIISGKIHTGDKLLAFYPSRFITSREKMIKDNFVKFAWSDFIDKINTIKSTKTDVACAALYIDINKVKESALKPSPQPQELRPKHKPIMSEEAQLISTDEDTGQKQVSTAIEVDKQELPPGNVHDKKPEKEVVHTPVTEQEVPQIIPTEFSSAKKQNIFDKALYQLRSFRRTGKYGSIRPTGFPYKKQVAVLIPVLIFVAIGGWLAKSYVFVSAEVKAQRALAKQTKENIKLAQEKVDGNDPLGARELLLSSLSNSSDINQELMDLLDKADGAVTANPMLVDKLPDDVIKKAEQIDISEGDVKSGKYNISLPALGMDLYEGNLYVLTQNKIFKVVDASKGSLTTVSWLKEGQSVSSDPVSIAIDGNVYVYGKSGVITKYYRGEKVKEFNTSVGAENSILLTAKDIPGLYIINKKLGRIYVVDKESGSVIKVLKIGNTQSLVAVYLDSQGVVYLASQDGKIWRIE